MLSKLEFIKQNIKDKLYILQCPICQSNLNIVNNCLKCAKGHSFDISKKGIILLHRKYQKKTDEVYTKQLFLHRRQFIIAGFYAEIQDYIKNFIKALNKDQITVLDLGAGECTHLKQITDGENHVAFGIDLSYDAISLATDYISDGVIPICGDIYNLPYNNKVFDLIINFLSPISAVETLRVMKDEGFIIKVIPTSNYLIELRKELRLSEYEKEDDILSNLQKNFNIMDIKRIETLKTLNDITMKHLFYMTPMTSFKSIFDCHISNISISLDVVILKKKSTSFFSQSNSIKL